MSTFGRNVTDIHDTLMSALIGVTITAVDLSVKFNDAEDGTDISLGARDTADGATIARALRGTTEDGLAVTPGDGNQLIQECWRHSFSVEFAYNVNGFRAECLVREPLMILDKAIDLIRAKLNPSQFGLPQFTRVSVEYDGPVRHPKNQDLMLQVLRVTVREYWRVSQ